MFITKHAKCENKKFKIGCIKNAVSIATKYIITYILFIIHIKTLGLLFLGKFSATPTGGSDLNTGFAKVSSNNANNKTYKQFIFKITKKKKKCL